MAICGLMAHPTTALRREVGMSGRAPSAMVAVRKHPHRKVWPSVGTGMAPAELAATLIPLPGPALVRTRAAFVLDQPAGLLSRIEAIPARTGKIRGRTETIRGRIEAFLPRTGAFRGRIETIRGRIEAFRGRTGTIRGRIEAFLGRIGAFLPRIEAFLARNGTIRGRKTRKTPRKRRKLVKDRPPPPGFTSPKLFSKIFSLRHLQAHPSPDLVLAVFVPRFQFPARGRQFLPDALPEILDAQIAKKLV